MGSRVTMAMASEREGTISSLILSIASANQRIMIAVPVISFLTLKLIGLPQSRVSIRASSSMFSSIRSAKRSRTALRSFFAIIDQSPDSNERRAAATARSTSSESHSATSVSSFPVEGQVTAKVLPDAAST